MADDNVKLALCGAVGSFLESADLSDFIIKCNGTTFNVHRFLLCLHSDVLAKWCTGDFKESKKGEVDLTIHEKQHIEALVKYLYTFDYSAEAIESHADKMSFHVTMCVIADKYNIAGLKTLSISKFKAIVNTTETASELVEPCLLAYGSAIATSVIRKLIVAIVVIRRNTLLPTTATEDSQQLEEAMRTYPDFAIDVAKYVVVSAELPPQCSQLNFKCDNAFCGHRFKTHLGWSRHISYTCPKCSTSRTGEGWHLTCRTTV
ncbi:hypothetical protein M409DRAFT_27708 [Zasmidium cellare ATCC 36951]|uniref:BTB domain-containing protein n=1 Tax=Zasmidium cellare ATCC 36951 TaxID=1080233 RepID=A0A6A6C7V1_ZASCE|nr:uncharacterized protein M409DRAFT_27708 [Zasmidium cellare ATCC 36951]KAF2161982.1 hypothetical protein M409DRAFT_27708 [Zasmidium cellare ATCC 36951]